MTYVSQKMLCIVAIVGCSLNATIDDRIEYKLERLRTQINILAHDVACINKDLDGIPFTAPTNYDGNVYPVELAVTPVSLSHVTGLSRLTPSLSPLRVCDITKLGGIWYRNTEDESWLVVNPTDSNNMIIVTKQDRYSPFGSLSDIILYTLDGGVSWNQVDVPLSKCQGPTLPRSNIDYDCASDPSVTFDVNGNAYFVGLSFNRGFDDFQNFSQANIFLRSTDKGQSWTSPQAINNDDGIGHFLDRPMIWADPYRENVLYTLWDDYELSAGFLKLSISTNAGTTWNPAIDVLTLDTSTAAWGPILFVLPDVDNTLVVAQKEVTGNGMNPPANFTIVRSSDGGQTWSSTLIFSNWTGNEPVDPADGNPFRCFSIGVDAAFDPVANNMYAVAQDAQFAPPGLGGAILTMSSDSGLNWTTPIPVNPGSLSAQAFLPSVAIAADGTVGVLFYDFRFYVSGDASLKTDVWLALYSPDLSSRSEIRLTPVSFDSRQYQRGGETGAPDYFPGDFCKLQASGNDFVATFCVTNPPYGIGPSPIPGPVFEVEDRNRQDVIFARVTRP